MSNDVLPAASGEALCAECGATLLIDGTCLRCAPPVMFQSEWLEPDRAELQRRGFDLIRQKHERGEGEYE